MDVVAGVILFVMVVYGLLGLIAPKVLMRAGRSVPGRSSWVLGGAFYQTVTRTRLTSGSLLAISLFLVWLYLRPPS